MLWVKGLQVSSCLQAKDLNCLSSISACSGFLIFLTCSSSKKSDSDHYKPFILCSLTACGEKIWQAERSLSKSSTVISISFKWTLLSHIHDSPYCKNITLRAKGQSNDWAGRQYHTEVDFVLLFSYSLQGTQEISSVYLSVSQI